MNRQQVTEAAEMIGRAYGAISDPHRRAVWRVLRDELQWFVGTAVVNAVYAAHPQGSICRRDARKVAENVLAKFCH